MKKNPLVPVALMAWLVLAGPVALAQDASAAQASASKPLATDQAADAHAIQQVMKKLFDKPGAPLTVHPVSVEGHYALAGWIQNQTGGRALLRKETKGWAILACGGDQLNQVDAFKLAGLSDAAAKQLVKKVRLAESRLTAGQRKKLSLFDGTIQLEGSSTGNHNTNHH